jgi:hypothetical protein
MNSPKKKKKKKKKKIGRRAASVLTPHCRGGCSRFLRGNLFYPVP